MSRASAVIGAGGLIVPRQVRAVPDTGHKTVAAADPHGVVGLLDQFGFNLRSFTDIDRLDRNLERLKRAPEGQRVHYISSCSPNYLHHVHRRLALRVGADAIWEKPFVINSSNPDALEEVERETGHRINRVLQLRFHPRLVAVRDGVQAETSRRRHQEKRKITPALVPLRLRAGLYPFSRSQIEVAPWSTAQSQDGYCVLCSIR